MTDRGSAPDAFRAVEPRFFHPQTTGAEPVPAFEKTAESNPTHIRTKK